MLAFAALVALLPSLAFAAPAPSPAGDWYKGAHKAYTAHSSCNATQKRLIGDGLDETLMLAGHARAHLRRFANDTIFDAWFGNETDSNLLLGLYDRIVDGDKTGLTFRCDDPDAECDGKYGVIPGYFRTDSKDETVVCPTYFLKKPQLENLCTLGQTLVANGSELTQGGWFMHRLLHTPTASGGQMSDVVDTVEEALALAQGVNKTQTAYSIHTVQYYALDVYASDVLIPGVGCRGEISA